MTIRSSVGRRMLAVTGITAMPPRAMALTATVVVAALAAVVAGVLLPVDIASARPPYPVLRFALATALMAVAQLARLRLRVASGVVSVTWGEAALIIGLYLVPAGWLPAAACVGAGSAWLLLSVFADRRTPVEVVHNAGLLTVAVTLATVVVTAFADPYDAIPTPALAAAAVVGSLTYLLVCVWLTALTLSVRQGLPVAQSVLRALRGKLLMSVGNVVVGLVVVAMLDRDARWILLLPPVLWLLQQTYSHRLRADDERRAWLAYAQATRALNQLDEQAVAVAGVTGAIKIFGATQVDLDVIRSDGRRWRHHTDPSGAILDTEVTGSGQVTGPKRVPAPDLPDVDAAPRPQFLAGVDEIVTRVLTVGPVHVGELRIRLPRSVLLGPREHATLCAFGDVLAVALHDATVNRERATLTARLCYAAVHDPLTDLVNRAALFSRGDLALRELDHDHPIALIVFDVNNFKEVNETLGHSAGDELLELTATRLRTTASPGELLGRVDGDEFAVLLTTLPETGGPSALGDRPPLVPHALRRAREIAELLAAPTEVAGVTISAEVSVGVVVAAAGAADMTELLRRADLALHQAKASGGAVASYDSAKDVATTDQLTLLAELREALAVDDQLMLALQPAVDLTTGEPTGVEALIRWRHPRRGKLNPTDFIRAVESSELLAPFTRYVVDKALTVAADWARHGLTVPISVNVSARSLLDPRLPAEIGELLRRHQVPAHRLVLEITETVVMSELDVIDEVLAALKALGVQLALDDFGTGFSSLTFLTRITVNEVKVDRSFVMRMAESKEAAAVVRATIGLGRELGLRVVAEGVETAEQRAALAALGCAAAQGYHFFRPMSSDKLVTVLRSLRDAAPAQVLPLHIDGVS